MHLAIISQYYPPETGAPQNRLSDLARRFVARGHTVQVLTALPNYPGTAIYPDYAGRANMTEMLDGVRVSRVGLYVPRKKTFLPRLCNYLTFALNARRRGAGLLAKPDLVLLESPPLFIALAAVPLARQWRAKLVVNISDLWPRTVVDMGMLRPGLALWTAEKLELWMYNNAQLITGQTEGIVQDIERRFPKKSVALYPNGVDLRRYNGQLNRAQLRAEFGWRDDQFVIGYTGVLGHAQALNRALDAAARQRDYPQIHWAFFGHGPCREQLERKILAEEIRSARIYPHQPQEKIPHLQAAFDAGLVPLAQGKVFEMARPSKMFEIMAAGRPLVLCARGESVRILNAPLDGPAGVVAAPEDADDLARQVLHLVQNPDLARAMGIRGQTLVCQQFDRQAIALKMEGIFQDLLEKSAPTGQ